MNRAAPKPASRIGGDPSSGPGGSGHRASILYVTYDGLLEPLGASQVVPYVRKLATRGFRIGVLSFEKRADLDSAERLSSQRDALARAGVEWTALAYHKSPTVPATAWDVIQGRRFVKRWSRSQAAAGRPHLVHARGYVPGLIGARAQRHGGRLVFDMRGFWVDERIEGGYWAPAGASVLLGRHVEKKLLGQADHIVLLTHRAERRLQGLAGRAIRAPRTVVPTTVDLDLFLPAEDPDASRRRLGLEDGPVLIHAGTLTGWYDGVTTMRIGRAFVERTGGTFVVLTRDVDEARRLSEEHAVRAHIDSVRANEVPAWLQAADAGLALVRPSPAKDASFPTRIGEYLASGLAVLATPVGDLEQLEDPGALRLLRDDADEAVSWLARAVDSPDRVRRARALAEEHLALDRGVETLANVYRSLGVDPGGP